MDIGIPAYSSNVYTLQALRALQLRSKAALHPAPPTVLLSLASGASPVDGQGYSAPRVPWTDARISKVGSVVVAGASSPDIYYGVGVNTNYGNGSAASGLTTIGGYGFQSNVTVYRWKTDAPVIDIGIKGICAYDLWVDSQPINRARKIVPTNANYFLNVDWGSNVPSYGLADSSTIAAGGSGHVVGDLITMSGGTGTQATVSVASVSGGAVTSYYVVNPGSYTATPSSPISQGSTSGAGTGFQLSGVWMFAGHTTRKMRTYELRIIFNGKFAGLHTGKYDTVLPWTPQGVKMITLGDSLTEGSFTSYPGGTFPGVAAELLGIENNIISGVGSTGYLASPSGKLTLRSRLSSDLYPYIPTDPTVPFIINLNMGINDILVSSAAAIQAEATLTLNDIITNCPSAYINVFGPFPHYLSTEAATNATGEAAIFAGVQAATGWTTKRHRTIPTVATVLVPNSGKALTPSVAVGNTSEYTGSDGTHGGQAYHDLVGAFQASEIVNSIAAWGV